MRLDDIPTPALVLDRARLQHNLAVMTARAQAAGVDLRPHLKTAKSAEVARLATAGHGGGITVSTLAEAAYFLAHGFSDVTYAVCMVPDKLTAVAALRERHPGAAIDLLIDSVSAARALAEATENGPYPHPVLIEVDSGEHRTGLDPEAAALVEVAGVVRDAKRLSLKGVLTHGGHAYACRTANEVRAVAEEERRAVVRAAERLRAAGHACSVVSAGSTPTAVHATSFEGLTEIRPGVYMFFDLAQHGLGACKIDDIAVTVLATVISHRPEHGRLIIDAGGLALSKDTSAGAFFLNAGYGWVADAAHARPLGDLHVAVADQEHGYVKGESLVSLADRLPIGSRVRVLPNHVCMTAAGYDDYVVVDGVDVVGRWGRARGWHPYRSPERDRCTS